MIFQRNMQGAIETTTDTNNHNYLFDGYVKPPPPPPSGQGISKHKEIYFISTYVNVLDIARELVFCTNTISNSNKCVHTNYFV